MIEQEQLSAAFEVSNMLGRGFLEKVVPAFIGDQKGWPRITVGGQR